MSLDVRRDQLLLQYYVRSLHLHNAPSRALIPSPYHADRLQPIVNLSHHSTFAEKITSALQNYGLNDVPVSTFKLCREALWELGGWALCEGFKCPPKKRTPPVALKTMFLEHLNNEHIRDIAIYTDESKNAQLVGCAAASIIGSTSYKLYPPSSIFTAELYAILNALTIAENSFHRRFVIVTDSKSTTQVLKHYNTTHPLVRRIIKSIIQLRRNGKSVTVSGLPSRRIGRTIYY